MTSISKGYRPFLLLCLIGFAGFFCSYMRIPVLPLFATSLGAGPAEVGMVNGAFMLATGLLSIPAGLLADRMGRRIPTIAGLAATAISSIIIAKCNSAGQMAAAYLLFGAGLAAFAPSMLTQVADVMPAERLGQAYGWYTTAIYGAMALGPAAGGFLAKTLGLHQVFYVSGVLLIIVTLGATAILPRPHPCRRADTHALLSASATLLHNRQLFACLLATLGTCVGFGIFLTFLPLHAAAKGLDPAQVGLVFATQALTNVASRIPVGMVADRLDRRILVSAGLICFAAGLSALGCFSKPVALMGCTVLLGCGMALTFTAIGALVAEAVQPAQRGLAMGMYNSCIYLGMMAGSTTLGFFIRRIGYPAGFVAGGITTMVTLTLFLLLMQRRRPDNLR